MISLEKAIQDIVQAEASDIYERDPSTFFCSQIGFCPRQLYVQKLGLNDADLDGKYTTASIIQSFLIDELTDEFPQLDAGVSVSYQVDGLRFVGRCTLVDRAANVAYMLKVRNGWYQFNPPVDRHLDQLHAYLKGLGIGCGVILYVSKNDVADCRRWPPTDAEQKTVEFDDERFDKIAEKADRIRSEIWHNGIASNKQEIPFDPCGCYFCNSEELRFPTSPMVYDSSPTTAETNTDLPTPETTTTAEIPTATGDGGVSIPAVDSESIETTGYHVPQPLKQREIWVVWDGEEKVVRAPWQTGTMYPAEWAEDGGVNPRRAFQKAQCVAEMHPKQIHREWPFPDNELPDMVIPTVLLRHDPEPPSLVVVDLDDVRDPATGEITGEALGIVEMLDGYTAVSSSRTGLHIYVDGELPPSDQVVIESLSEEGQIEVYDHSRFIAATWNHVADTPKDTIPERTDEIQQLVGKYTSQW